MHKALIDEYDIALASRIQILTPATLQRASREFITY